MLERLEKDLTPSEWRGTWVGALALLRAIGHVLEKVDSQDAVVAKLQASQFKQMETDKVGNAIFWQFIKKNRDLALKEYELSVWDEPTIDVFYGVAGAGSMSSLDSELYRPILDGFGGGEDARDVYRSALEWWDGKLSEIERVT